MCRLALSQVFSIDLKGANRLGMYGYLGFIMPGDVALPSVGQPARPHHLAQESHRGQRVDPCCCECVEAEFEPGPRGWLHRHRTRIGPGSGIRHQSKLEIRNGVFARYLHTEYTVAQSAIGEEKARRRRGITCRRGARPGAALPLDLSHNAGIPTEPGAEQEVSLRCPVVEVSHSDHARRTTSYRLQHGPTCLHGVGGKSQSSDEHIGAAPRQRGKGGTCLALGNLQNPVGGLIDRAITTEAHHELTARFSGLLGELCSVVAMSGVHNPQIEVTGERADNHVPRSCRGRAGPRIDDE